MVVGSRLLPDWVVTSTNWLQQLSRIMQKINMKYASFFKRKYHGSGHLWQGRVTSESSTTRSWCRELNLYMRRNSLEAILYDDLVDYF